MAILNKYIVECPSGYFYAGDDTPPDGTDALQSYWEVGRSPVYSCYKRIPGTNGINDGLEQCYTSVMDSDNMEARVVIFEDAKEVERVFNSLDDKMTKEGGIPEVDGSYTILTSAMRFVLDKEHCINCVYWIYLGTSKYYSYCDKISSIPKIS